MELRIRGEPTVAGECAGESNSSARGEEVIRWERFLPRRWLRVLLVENDDSTRHIVAALLRKCSYQVAAVADGLKAWEVLKKKNYNFDLVLTEVSTPSLSGIGLLSKIMSNGICKNVPVIMMSSQDSATIVFKCMLKGAADFLVKPVRKNELQNLWQHVWRKHCSSSSRNVFENGYPIQTGHDVMSNDDAASNCASANACDTANEEGSREKRNDTQSPCNNMETEFESEENQGKSMLKTVDYDAAKMTTISTYTNRETEGQEINVTLSTREENNVDREVANNMRCIDGTSEWNSDSLCPRGIPDEPSIEIIDFIGTRAAGQCSHTIVEGNHHNEDALCKAAKSSHSKESASKGGSSALWELSLRRPQLNNGCAESSFQAKHVLKHSDASAFSRYGNKDLTSTTSGSSLAMLCTRTVESKAGNGHSQSADNEIGNGVTLSFSTNENLSSTIVKGGEALNNKNEELEPLATNTTNKSFFRHVHNLGLFSLPVPIGSIPFQSLCAGSGAIVRPIFYSDPSVPQCGPSSVEKIIDVNHSDLQYINHHHYSIYQQCHQLHAMRDQIGDFQLPNSSVFLNTQTEKANQSGAPSRSALDDSGSNGSNEDTTLATNMGAPLRNANENGFQDCNGQGLDSDRARREAALAKFRLKRKERCFEKKTGLPAFSVLLPYGRQEEEFTLFHVDRPRGFPMAWEQGSDPLYIGIMFRDIPWCNDHFVSTLVTWLRHICRHPDSPLSTELQTFRDFTLLSASELQSQSLRDFIILPTQELQSQSFRDIFFLPESELQRHHDDFLGYDIFCISPVAKFSQLGRVDGDCLSTSSFGFQIFHRRRRRLED